MHVLGQTIKKIDHLCLLYTYRLKTLNLFPFFFSFFLLDWPLAMKHAAGWQGDEHA